MAVILETPEKELEIEFLRCGTHTSMSGSSHNFTHDIAQEVVDTYNPDIFKAPLIVSHKTGKYSDRQIVDSELAFGTPKLLRKVGDRVKAIFEKISPEFVEWVRNSQILGISPSFYPPDHPSNPTPGKWSLRHIAGLGKSPPAIKGLASLSLSEFLASAKGAIDLNEFDLSSNEGIVTLDFMGNDRMIISLFQRLRDYLIDTGGLETADKIIAPYELQMLSETRTEPDYQMEMLDRLTLRVQQLESQVSPLQNYKEMTEETTKLETDLHQREAKLEATAAELAKQAQKIAARQAELDRKEDTDFAESLIKDGRALPNEKEKLVTMMGTMRKSETVVEFSEDDKPQMLDAFKDMLSKRPPVIAFGEHAKPDGKPKHGSINFSAPEGTEVDMEALEVHEKALAYQEAHPGTDYMSAIAKVGY
ncbi:coiled-coil domain-containing protein [Chroococcidiopsis sp.]|uniref:coiled-coil domain-containing protein n=1 Tax=Chroococcidiopsis sp. TaxID=3088168 RepID=UPI003F398FA6